MTREANRILDFHRTVGDTKPSIGLQLLYENASEQLAVFDLTDYAMTYEVIDDADDTEYVTETADNITKTDAANGKVSIDVTALAATVGVYWIRVYGTDSGSERRSWPPDGRRIRLTIDDGV